MSSLFVKLFPALVLAGALSCGEVRTSTRGRYTQLSGADAIEKKPLIKEVLAETGNTSTIGCDGKSVKKPAESAEFEYIDIIEGTEKTLKASKSLCDILAESGKEVGIYQFINPNSKVAVKQVDNIYNALTVSAFKKSIQQFIIISGPSEQKEVDKIIGILAVANPDSKLYEDSEDSTFSAFTATPGEFDIPTLVTMAKSTRGLTITGSSDKYLDIVRAAENLLKEEVPGTATEKSIFEIDSLVGWDGLSNLGTVAFDIISTK
jgi:hypothetical protein